MTNSHSIVHDDERRLPDRRGMHDAIEGALVRLRAEGEPCAMLLIDVDGLADVGEERLTALVARLAASLGADDLVARFGGDVIAAVVRGVADEDAAHELGARLKRSVEELSAAGPPVRVSIGFSILRENETSAGAFVGRADAAVYAARNKASRDARGDDSRPLDDCRRTLVEAAFECSTVEDFDVYYQPIADLRSGSVAAIEAVAHWEHPDLGTIAPGEFLPIAEWRGQIVTLGRWVLEKACAQSVRWAPTRDGQPMRTCVNVAAAQVADPAFADDVLAALARGGATGHQLALGIPQDALAAISSSVVAVLADARIEIMLRNVGASAGAGAVDLRQLPITMIKLDGSLVTRCASDDVPALLQRTTELARSIDARAVAAGIETLEQLAIARDCGFALAQGYLFRRPQSPASIEQLVYGERPFAGLLAPRPAWLDLPLDGDAPTIEIGAPAVP
ncbi:MAG TPA: bifunctional diguanylate cyclase/phosphodiesterase [Solirubrobacteraceae bacterium]|jgi:diguanylate cyclase (GGDEF)-like protein|nr:bifunctional diguanylate cyclase/phosphodiesterase [Solirubrobacteraceae bacterium]